MNMYVVLLTVLISVAASKNEEQCNDKNLGPWKEPLNKPEVSSALKIQFGTVLTEAAAAISADNNFKKLMQTVATVTPDEFKARSIKVGNIEAEEGKIEGLKKAFSKPKLMGITASGKRKQLSMKFEVDLSKLQVKFHVQSSKPKFNNDIQWQFRSGTTAYVKIDFNTTSGCSLDFGGTEVKSNFVQKGESAAMNTLTDKLKCYIHIILEQAVNFVLQILKGVLDETVCLSFKPAQSTERNTAETIGNAIQDVYTYPRFMHWKHGVEMPSSIPLKETPKTLSEDKEESWK